MTRHEIQATIMELVEQREACIAKAEEFEKCGKPLERFWAYSYRTEVMQRQMLIDAWQRQLRAQFPTPELLS